MRLFIAVDLTDSLREQAQNVQSSLKGDWDVGWVPSQNLHFTLKFLGEVHEDQVKDIVKEIEELLGSVKPFSLGLEGAGYFGTPKYLRVLWLRVKEGKQEMIDLMKQFNSRLDFVRKDTYPPRVHLTLGRVKSNRNVHKLAETIDGMKNVKIGTMDVKTIVLKQSILGRGTPRYEDVKQFSLG